MSGSSSRQMKAVAAANREWIFPRFDRELFVLFFTIKGVKFFVTYMAADRGFRLIVDRMFYACKGLVDVLPAQVNCQE
jgi:hypothetical protein